MSIPELLCEPLIAFIIFETLKRNVLDTFMNGFFNWTIIFQGFWKFYLVFLIEKEKKSVTRLYK